MGSIPTGSVPATETETATIVETETSPTGVTTTYPYVAANITWTIADNTIASFVTNADGSATFTGLKAGSTTGTVTDSATGAVQNYDLTVTAAPANTFAIAVTFGTPSLPTAAAGTASASTLNKPVAHGPGVTEFANDAKAAVGPGISPMYTTSQAHK
jgi:hypothetical protein